MEDQSSLRWYANLGVKGEATVDDCMKCPYLQTLENYILHVRSLKFFTCKQLSLGQSNMLKFTSDCMALVFLFFSFLCKHLLHVL